jgi:multidrug efflux pump subunit AcrB
MHPFCFTIIRRPDLVIDHLSAYAALLQQEASQASQTLVNRVLIWCIAITSAAICVVFSGTALMVGVLNNQFHWILVAVPGSMAICALVAISLARKPVLAEHFSNVKSQLLSDAQALRTASGHKVQ